MGLVPIFQYKPVPPITYWWIWMSLQEVNISIGTQIRSGSTMINTHWHAKIDAQQLFNCLILPVGRILIDLAVSITGTLQRCPQNFLYLSSRKNALPGTMKVPVVQRWGPLVKISKCTQLLQLRWEVIKKNKNKWELPALVSSHSLDEETPVESQSNGPCLTSEVHIAILFFVLKAASEEHSIIRVLCGDIDCRLPAPVLCVQN